MGYKQRKDGFRSSLTVWEGGGHQDWWVHFFTYEWQYSAVESWLCQNERPQATPLEYMYSASESFEGHNSLMVSSTSKLVRSFFVENFNVEHFWLDDTSHLSASISRKTRKRFSGAQTPRKLWRGGNPKFTRGCFYLSNHNQEVPPMEILDRIFLFLKAIFNLCFLDYLKIPR